MKRIEITPTMLIMIPIAIIGIAAVGTFYGVRYILETPRLVPAPDLPPSVIMICVDSLRYDAVNPTLMPNLSRFADSPDTLSFDRAYAAAPWTLASVASVYTGLYPHQHGAMRDGDVLPEYFDTIAEDFQGKGYETVAIVNNYHVSDKVGLDQGFDEMMYEPKEIAGKQFTKALLWRLDRTDSSPPYFMYIHLMETHVPYAPIGEEGFAPDDNSFRYDEYTDTEKALIRDLYDRSCTEVDTTIGAFISILPDDVTLIIFSDHGEEFWDNGEMEHGHSLREVVTRVPLIIRDGEHSGRLRGAYSLTWLKDYLETGDATWRRSDPIYADACIYGDDRVSVIEHGVQAIYNFRHEEISLYNLRADLRFAPTYDHYKDLIFEFLSPTAEPLSDEEAEMLRSLGYIGRGR